MRTGRTGLPTGSSSELRLKGPLDPMRALLVPSPDHPMDATIWPRETLLHMKSLGGDRSALYDQAVREGLFP